MRLLSLDFDPVYGEATRSTFAGDESVFDYDVVIWDPAASFSRYKSAYFEYYRGLPSFDEHRSVRVQADVGRRRSEFGEFINAGRVVVVIVRPPQECYIDTGKRTYSGTGRNRQTTREVAPFDLLSSLPVADSTKFVRASGTRIEFDGDGAMVRFLRKYAAQFNYQAVITDAPGAPLARVVGTDRIVGSIQRSKGGGYLILLPAINLEAEYDDEPEAESNNDGDEEEGEDWLPQAPEFQMDLLASIEELTGTSVLSRPAWVDNYATEEQQRLRIEVVKQQARIEAARAKLTKLQRQKEAAEAKDQLFLGTGRALELEVKSVLELLGGVVTEPLPGRDDWRVTFPEGDAVVEVKGVTKSAAEKHAAQLEKWVAGAMEETGNLPKGILVVNTWRELQLSERTKVDFPTQMLPYCQGRNHCLVTGLQLFVIQADIEKDSNRAEYWRSRILETAGPIQGADDWRSVIGETILEP